MSDAAAPTENKATAAATGIMNNPKLVEILKQIKPIVQQLEKIAFLVLPHLITAYRKAKEIYAIAPEDVLKGCGWLAVCFFGGCFTCLLAAYEALQFSQWATTKAHLTTLWLEAEKVAKKSKEEDSKALANLNPSELIRHKCLLALTCTDPNNLNLALTGVYSAFLCVVATLKIKFAKVVALGAALGNIFHKTCSPYLEEALNHTVPDDYKKWIPMVVSYSVKALSVSLAWMLQRIISAFHSSIRGGHKAAQHFLRFGSSKGLFTYDEDQYYDEALGYSLGVLGFYFQYSLGFGQLFFPLNLMLMPLTTAETILEYYVGAE